MDEEKDFNTNVGYIFMFQLFSTLQSFAQYSRSDNLPHSLDICLPVALALVICLASKKFLQKRDSENGISMLDRCKRDYKIGLGGISFIGILSHLRLIAADSTLEVSITVVHILSSTIIFCFFVLPARKYSYVKDTSVFFYLNYGSQILVILASWKIEKLDENDFLAGFKVFARHYSITIVTIKICILLFSVLKDRVYLLSSYVSEQERAVAQNEQNAQVQVATVPEESSEDSDDDGEEIDSLKTLECNICVKRFKGSSKRRTPRILTNCGHSLCHKCLETLSGSKGFVICPTCMKKTVVPVGGVKMLPKNYIALGLLEEINGRMRLEKKPVEKEEIVGAVTVHQ
ncbi:unnamed protein product [Caenorhabditis brenneri]